MTRISTVIFREFVTMSLHFSRFHKKRKTYHGLYLPTRGKVIQPRKDSSVSAPLFTNVYFKCPFNSPATSWALHSHTNRPTGPKGSRKMAERQNKIRTLGWPFRAHLGKSTRVGLVGYCLNCLWHFSMHIACGKTCLINQ